MSFRLQECMDWLGDNALCLTCDAECVAVALDSRTIQSAELFAAFVGENTNGNNYITGAMAHGAAGVITEATPYINVPTLQVKNLRSALDTIAHMRRANFVGTVVGLTGSVGKTSTKNACAHMLAHSGTQVMATDGNYNNQLGVPITLSRLDNQDIAFVELGISHPDDMNSIASMTAPHVSILTNVASAHGANFSSIAAIAKEKGHIIDHTDTDGVVIVNCDDAFYLDWRKRAGNRRMIAVGYDERADVRITAEPNTAVVIDGVRYAMMPTTLGRGALWASAYAMAVALACDMSLADTAALAATTPTTPGRMELITMGHATVIHDCYNANPVSMQAALEATVQYAEQQHLTPVFVLGTMHELGEQSLAYHQAVGTWLGVHAPCDSIVWTVGEEAAYIADACNGTSHHFTTTEALITALQAAQCSIPDGALVLLKASRACALERLLPHFTHSTVTA